MRYNRTASFPKPPAVSLKGSPPIPCIWKCMRKELNHIVQIHGTLILRNPDEYRKLHHAVQQEGFGCGESADHGCLGHQFGYGVSKAVEGQNETHLELSLDTYSNSSPKNFNRGSVITALVSISNRSGIESPSKKDRRSRRTLAFGDNASRDQSHTVFNVWS